MGPRRIWRDLCRSIRGAVAFRRYLRSQDTIDIALGLFEAASSTVVVGRPCRYVIRVANVGDKVWDVKVTFQLSLIIAANVPAQPAASFAKHCTVLPRRTTAMEFYYDWGATAVFTVDKVASPPDECYMGEIKTGQCYVVSAILTDHTGKHLDHLDMSQELKG